MAGVVGRANGFSRFAFITAVAGASVSPALAGDPGDLFPNVSYDGAVHNPVRDPGRGRQPRRQPGTTNPATTRATTTRPAATSVASTRPAATMVASSQPADRENAGTSIWGPYRLAIMEKFLSADEQAEYDDDFADQIKKALSVTTADRKATLDGLAEAVATRSENIKKFVLLNVVGLSVKTNAPLEERSARAMLVMPLLKEQTLEVAQARADCLNILAMSAPEMASDKLWGMLAEADATLAQLQIQAGFPAQAVESFQKAKAAYVRMKDKKQCHSEILVESGAWVDHTQFLTVQLPNYKKVLAATPADTEASTHMAMAHLVLYGDLESMKVYAVNASDSLKALAGELDAAAFPKMSAAPATAVADSLKIAEKLLAVAREATDQVEKYSLAKLIVDRLDLLKRDYPEAVAKDRAFNTIHNGATKFMKENAFKPVKVGR